jgi:hypothetical protein
MKECLLRVFARFHSRGKGRSASRPQRPASRVTPSLECLEDRSVPTILFQPSFGPETVLPGSSYTAMQSPPVYLTFWGSSWGSLQGSQDVNRLTAAVNKVLGSPYLTGLTQYGSDGQAVYGGRWVDLSNPPANFSVDNLRDFLQKTIDNASTPIPRPTTPSHPPIYVVVTDPNATSDQPDAPGYNTATYYCRPSFLLSAPRDPLHADWTSTHLKPDGTGVDVDDFTLTFSHELVETISTPFYGVGPGGLVQPGIMVAPPPSLPVNFRGDNQIADNEPDAGHYSYRLNDVLVEPYWSGRDQAFIVPDGSAEMIRLTPLWQGVTLSLGGQPFYVGRALGQFDLAILGNQSPTSPTRDRITLDEDITFVPSNPLGVPLSAELGVTVTQNDQFAAFAPQTIQNITVSTAAGTNSVRVVGVPADVNSVTVTSTGVTNDTVTIGGAGKSLTSIAAPVSVSNRSGHTTLIVDDSRDPLSRNVTVTNSSVAFSGLPTVTYTSPVTLADGTLGGGVTALTVLGGYGGNTFTVSSTAAHTPLLLIAGADTNLIYVRGAAGPVTINGAAGSTDYVTIGTIGRSLAGIVGPVNVSNSSGQTFLTIDDYADTGRRITLTDHSVAFQGGTTVNYDAGGQWADGTRHGVRRVDIFDGNGLNVIEADSVSALTPVTISGTNLDRLTGPAAGTVTLNRYRNIRPQPSDWGWIINHNSAFLLP